MARKPDNRQIGEKNLSVLITNYQEQEILLDPSIVVDLVIHESLYDNSTHGEITILDLGGFEERIPIIGQERIQIKFGSKSNTSLSFQIKEFIVYSMSPKLIDESKKQAYVLYFVSEEYISNLKFKVSRSYKSRYAQDIVSDIYSEFISNDVRFPKTIHADGLKNLDSSVYRMSLVMAHFRPFECINLVAKRSVPARGLGRFLFYEDKDGFNFKSIESLLNPKSTLEDMDRDEGELVQTSEVNLEENAVTTKYVLMPASALSDGGTFDLSGDDTIITSFKFESVFNVVANMVGGMYSSRLMTYDPVTHRIGAMNNQGASSSVPDSTLSSRNSNVKSEFYDFNYKSRFRQFTHVKGPAHSLCTGGHFGIGYPNSFYAYKSTNFERNLRPQINLLSVKMANDFNIDNQVERWLLPNMSQKRQLKNIVLSVRVPGDHARTVGELVNVDLPSSYFRGENHKYYSGNYLITDLSHKIMGDNYYMDMKLAKDALNSSLFENQFGATEQELLDAGADQSFINALQEDTNVWEDEIGDEEP